VLAASLIDILSKERSEEKRNRREYWQVLVGLLKQINRGAGEDMMENRVSIKFFGRDE
jgi:hypothetical protein